METDIFCCVKQNVTARDAAERYGIKVSGNGMAQCPFHPDRTPSMKIDARYHCFGCGADGDVINLVEQLFHVSPIDAARKLAEDFGIPVPDRHKLSVYQDREFRRKQAEGQKVREMEDRYHLMERQFFLILTDYFHRLRRWKENYFPKSLEEEPDRRFTEALRNMAQTEYVLDYFISGGIPERVEIMNDLWEKVSIIGRNNQGPDRIAEERAGGAPC